MPTGPMVATSSSQRPVEARRAIHATPTSAANNSAAMARIEKKSVTVAGGTARYPGLLDPDEDAPPGALLGGLDDRLFEVARHVGQPLDATRVTERLAAFSDVGKAVVEEGEDVGTDLLAQAIARAEVLVDPHLHGHAAAFPPELQHLNCCAGRTGTVPIAFS